LKIDDLQRQLADALGHIERLKRDLEHARVMVIRSASGELCPRCGAEAQRQAAPTNPSLNEEITHAE
jgi:hypothetical protein